MANLLRVLKLCGVSVHYGAHFGLRDLSLEIGPGELVGVLGPNGAGKSTLLRVAAGLLAPSLGSVTWADRPLATLKRRDIAREVAFVPQHTEIAFAFSALEIVLMGRAPQLGAFSLETERDLAIAEAALKEVDAWALRDRSFHTLSGGERQRVVLARALCQQPRLLLLDEPSAFLDIQHQVELYDTLRVGIREKRFSVLTALHDLNLAAQACDRVLLLREGRMLALGTIEEVLTYGRIRETFGVDVYVGVNELTGSRYFLPMLSERRVQ